MLCQHILAQADRLSGVCALIDADHMFNPLYAEQCGVALDELYLAQPTTAEQAFDMAERLARSAAFAVVVIDSLTGLIPQEELAAPYGTPVSSNLDHLLARWLPQLNSAIHHTQTALILTDQTKTGVSRVYHELENHLSRIALPLTASLRLRLETISAPLTTQEIRRIRVQGVKNKFAPCFKSVTLDIIVNRGINKIGEILDLGVESGTLSRQGSGYFYQGKRLGATRQETSDVLGRSPQLADELERVIRLKMRC